MPSTPRLRHAAAIPAVVLSFLPSLQAPARAADTAELPPFSTAPVGAPPAAWKFATLPHKVPTQFTVAELDGEKVLKVEAQESYGNIVVSMKAAPTGQGHLSWRWRVDKLVENADIKVRSGDDSPAKICLFFAFDESRLSLAQRTKLSLARSSLGENVPAESVCYVWDNKVAAGTSLENAFTPRIRMIVLESGTEKLGRWVEEKRDFAADYARLFADESGGQIPEISGVAISADADNTHGHSLAYFGDVSLVP